MSETPESAGSPFKDYSASPDWARPDPEIDQLISNNSYRNLPENDTERAAVEAWERQNGPELAKLTKPKLRKAYYAFFQQFRAQRARDQIEAITSDDLPELDAETEARVKGRRPWFGGQD
jgi:hypothetical protein